MKRLIRLFALAIGLSQGSIAQAAWTLIGRTDIFRIYVEDKQITRSGDFALILQLTDYTVAQWVDPRTAIGSIRHQIEFDCRQRLVRILSAAAFSEQMEAGSLIASEKLTNPEWTQIDPESTAEKVEKFACRKE